MNGKALFVLAGYFGGIGYVIAKKGYDKKAVEAINQMLDRRVLRDTQIMRAAFEVERQRDALTEKSAGG